MILPLADREKLQAALEKSMPGMEESTMKNICRIILALIYDISEMERNISHNNATTHCASFHMDACLIRRLKELTDECQKIHVANPFDESSIHKVSLLAENFQALSERLLGLRELLIKIQSAKETGSLETVQ